MPEPALSPLERAAMDAASARDARISGTQRRAHGVVHTPVAICRFVVEQLEVALKNAGLSEGLGTEKLTIVDPACGTGLFFASLLTRVDPERVALIGFDTDADAIEGAKANFDGLTVDWRTGDALEGPLMGDGPLAILGNPPWSSRSATKTEYSEQTLEVFRRDGAGARLQERKLGVLSDAYVRFFAWVHAAFVGRPGAFCLVANGSFIDGPVHRGMRGALASRFSLTVTDLGGSSLVARDAAADDNVFGVRPAVSVVAGARGQTGVRYVRLFGTRHEKLAALSSPLAHEPVKSEAPSHDFSPIVGAPFPAAWQGLDALVVFHGEGVQTNRDAVVVDASRDDLLGRMQALALNLALPAVEAAEVAKSHYDPERARKAVRNALASDPTGEGWIRPLVYRPYDERHVVVLPELCHRPRRALA
ncbi:MAG: type ISP restriction/modification enzyme, partial [Myxococcota bacterium]